jgi:hypothetical protein
MFRLAAVGDCEISAREFVSMGWFEEGVLQPLL